MHPEPAGNEASRTAGWLAAGAWAGLMLAAARVGVIWAMAGVGHSGDPVLVGSRVASALPGILAQGLALGWLGALILTRPAARASARHLALVVAAAGFAWLLLGWSSADVSLRVGVQTRTGLLAAGGLAFVALVLAWFVPVLARLGPRPWPPLILAALGAGLVFVTRPPVPEAMSVRRVSLELSALPFELVDSGPEQPRSAVLCPSPDPMRDGADLQGLLLPPPARVRFQLGGTEPKSRLTGRVGIDHDAPSAVPDGLAVEFRVVLDGREALLHSLPLGADEWVDLGDDGLALAGVEALELETRLVDARGAPVELAEALPAGFGGLAVEQRQERPRTRASRRQPNIVLIVIDTLRADRCSAHGYARDTTPNLERLAARGLAFDEASATSSWTWPSTASILTGLQPQEHGVTDKRSCFLPLTLETLPEALQRAGFSTAGWSANPLINTDKNFAQGFELFDANNAGGMRRSEVLMPAALDWIELMAEWRFFLYLHLVDPHAPLSPLAAGRARFAPEVPADFDPRAITEYGRRLLDGGEPVDPEHQRWISDLYDACVWSADHWIGRVLDRLDELELTDETIVVVTSDHGEELFDHGFATHGHSLFRELTRVPLVMAGPGIPTGERVDVPVSNRHLAPTLARLGGAELAGADALDLLRPAADPVFTSTTAGWWEGEYPRELIGLRQGTRVVHVAPFEAGAPGGVRLYDLENDPGERVDLTAELPDEAARLRTLAEGLRRTLTERRHAPRIEAGAATLERLRRLGYVGGQR